MLETRWIGAVVFRSAGAFFGLGEDFVGDALVGDLEELYHLVRTLDIST